MTNATTDAAKMIADKAERIIARLRDDAPKGAEKRRQASALLQIAAEVGGNPKYADRALALGGAAITEPDRQTAAKEAYSLAMRREEAGSMNGYQAGKTSALKPGWIKGGDDFGMPMQPDRLREAVALYDIALSLQAESFLNYRKGLLQERLGDYSGAVHTFENIRGSYTQYSVPHLERCRAKLAGSYDPEAAANAAFGNLSQRAAESDSPEDEMTEQVVDALLELLDGNGLGDVNNDDDDAFAEGEEDTGDDQDDSDGELDLAATIALTFAELLVDRDFKSARAMLAKDLKHLKAADLEREFNEMMGVGEDEDEDESTEFEVGVVSSANDMPAMKATDVGWVCVSISGNDFIEAVTVIVTQQNGDMKIRELEWGRP